MNDLNRNTKINLTVSELSEPISRKQRDITNANRSEISKCLRIDGSLLVALQSRNVLTEEMVDTIRYSLIESNKISLLLDYLMKGSKEKMREFVKVLLEHNQPHVAALFIRKHGMIST